jgi:phosphoribosylglycinamide formyltransferase
MIHHMIEEVDAGEPVVTREIPFVAGEDDDIAEFEAKVHRVEHEVVIEGVRRAISEIREVKTKPQSI